ncbi:MAG: hypothetical protein D6773_16360, partial [Alphaproteobacteria bacterium]
GGGTAVLDLPDVEFTKRLNENVGAIQGRQKDSEDFGDELGWNVNGSLVIPMTGANGNPKYLSINGFYARIDDDDSRVCASPASGTATCAWININGGTINNIADAGLQTVVNTSREVDHWGVSVESKWQLSPSVMGVTRAPHRRYLALGLDVRGIDQETRIRTTNNGPGRYDEDLDTTYYGAYGAWGGDYSLPFFSRLTSGLGLQSSFMLRGGLYYADTDYDGTYFTNFAGLPDRGNLSLSSDDAAFIGGLVLETRKPLGQRASLSLKSEYEYYSHVPTMAYTDQAGGGATGPNAVTRIEDDDAYSIRSMLRLNVKLGPVADSYK